MKAKNFAMAAALVMAAFSATAATVTLNLASGGTDTGYVYGNVRTFTTASGVTVKASAWSLTGGYNNDKFESSYLGQYSGFGLGVCNRDEQCNNSDHRVDNSGRLDFVLFQFSAAIDPLSVRIDPVGNYDRDVSYWTGTTANPLNLSGKSLNNFTSLGFGAHFNDDSTQSNKARDVSIVSGLANSLIFGADIFSDNDWFKISSITFNYTPPAQVPEPGSLALIALALGGLGLARRRRAA